MASELTIYNLALSHLGDVATVSSIDPPEGSPQAQHCANFYPIARDSLLEMHSWGFATKRVRLAQLANISSQWAYCYAQPSDALNLLDILDEAALNDYSVLGVGEVSYGDLYTPKDFSTEALSDGTLVIYTNQENAVLRYTSTITDPTKFSALFTTTLTWYLASMIAGPLLKGAEGMNAEQRCLQVMNMYLSQAKNSDANQRQAKPAHNVPWITGR